ncbi:MAG: hypothetical protein HC915_05275, partial [Anaerolineae bacterium]|nr:hypothetical protein [Anaerolineae bacterium]
RGAAGALKLLFAFPEMSEAMVDAMLNSGCVARFEDITLTTSAVTGTFTAEDAAAGAFRVTACELGEFGVQFLAAPLEGMWSAAPGEPADMTLLEQPLTLAEPPPNSPLPSCLCSAAPSATAPRAKAPPRPRR